MSAFGGPNIITDGLVLSLDAGNVKSYPGSGTTWYDKSGNGNNGTLTNGPTFSNGSIVFDGVDDYVNLPSSFKFSDSNLTLNVCFKTNTNSNSYQDLIIFSDPLQNNILGLLKNRSGLRNGSVYAVLYENGIGSYITSSLSGDNLVSAGITNYTTVFEKIGGVYNIFLYRNGVLDGSTVVSSLNSYNMNNWTNYFVRIGSGGPTYPEILNGNIYCSYVYNRALTASEVLQNYNATKTRFGL